MSFKRIEVLGFKSFADKLAIEFGNGITAIVGPNGCGKSNFADAIRWVLGEQAPKNLRGSSMQDVIFKGSENRKSLSYCEVSLVFGNEDKQFNLDYDEVVISRKLYRNGTSEYSLNRSPCLLKDITNLLHDSGIGRDGYSIIGQGKVSQIVASKPEERRVIFEEAAGIAKFKERKNEAERKLGRTRENLALIENTVLEIERQLMPMKQQAENAKKYLSLRERLKSQEVNNYIYHYENAAENKQRISDYIKGLKEEAIEKENLVKAAVEKQTQTLDGIKDIDNEIQALNDEILRLTVEIEKQAGDKRVAMEKVKHLAEQAEKLEQEISEDKVRFEQLSKDLQSKQEQKNQTNEELNALQAKLNELQDIYVTVLEQLRASEEAVSGSQKEIEEAVNKLSDIKSNITRLETELNSIGERDFELEERRKNLAHRKESAEIVEREAHKECLEVENLRKNAFNNLNALRENLQSVHTNIEQLQAELNGSQAILMQLESRQKLLKEMQTEYEGYNNSVRKLLLDAGKNNELRDLIVDIVGELISVPAQLETAIEMALGYSIQNVVTKTEDDAKKLVAYLKNKGYGRATFLPISTVKPKFIPDNMKKLLDTAGCYGIANELIDYDSELEPVFKSLLGNTVIVDNIDTAVKLAKLSHFGFKIVTLEGDIINVAGSLTGGSKKSELNNLLSREREIENISERLKVQGLKVTEQQNTLNNYNDMHSKLLREIDMQTKLLHDYDLELAQKEEILKHAQDDYQIYSDELDEINQESARLNARKEILTRELEQSKTLDRGEVKAEGNKGSGNTKYDFLRDKRDMLTNDITELKVEIATKQALIGSLESDIERIIGEQEEISNNLDENNAILVKNARTLETVQELEGESHILDNSETETKLHTIKRKIEETENLKQTLHSSLAGIEEERTMRSGEFNRIQEQIYQQEAKLAQIDTNIENMQDRILEDYELTYLTALNLKDPEFEPSNCAAAINELKREISKLGNVNVNAIEDSIALDERYTDLSTQLEDLRKAENDIMTVINELAEQMIVQFSDAFQKINSNFSRIFRELFGGGKACLKLTDDDILSAGVDIEAEPPGKVLGNLSLLSGGEQSLTAIAILFAILKLRPMPFCLLDEIDAALDDANVERFAKYLHNFAGETQFIVITHRKPTMELADNLYGVTMEQKGVSKVVSVKLSEAIQTVGV